MTEDFTISQDSPTPSIPAILAGLHRRLDDIDADIDGLTDNRSEINGRIKALRAERAEVVRFINAGKRRTKRGSE